MKCIVTTWTRDPLATVETERARLLDMLDTLAQTMRDDPAFRLVAGGETALLDEIAELRPDLRALLMVYNAAERLTLGPWHIQPQALLVSGESLVRNLLVARADADRYYGISLSCVAFATESSGFPAQLPQILRGFGIETLLVTHGASQPVACWKAPDNSQVLVLDFSQSITHDSQTIQLWPYGQPQEGEQTGLESLPEKLRRSAEVTVTGELFAHMGQPGRMLYPGVLSNRLYLKLINARLQAELTYKVEPWLALANTHGKLRKPQNLRALAGRSWRLLLKNQHGLNGTGSDAVHAEQEARARQIEDINQHVVDRVLRSLPGKPGANISEKTHIVVWNPHNWRAQQVVEVAVQLPADRSPERLVDANGRETAFAWADGRLIFPAEAPPVGYTTYTLYLSHETAAPQHERERGTSISSTLGDERLEIANNQLVWRHIEPALVKAGELVREALALDQSVDLLRFFDGGDAGDAFNYSPPETDILAQANLLPGSEVEQTRVYQRLILQHRLRLAPSLNDTRERVRGVKSLDLTTTATLYHHVPGIHFRTTFDNSVHDHRLRAHISTGLHSKQVIAGAAFGLAHHEIAAGGFVLPAGPDREAPVSTRPMHSFCAVDDGSETLALLARGLPEYEALQENGQITLALTLLRAVGWRSRDDLRSRTASAGRNIAIPGAQCERSFTVDYALIMLPPNDPAALVRAGQLHDAPLQAYQYQERPPLSAHSYLTIEGDGVVMTALKPPQTGDGWIVRLLNPTESAVKAQVRPVVGLKSAQIVNLAEESQTSLDVSDTGSVPVTIQPHQLLTLRLGF